MWFEVFIEFCENLLPTIQQTALSIMEFLTYEIKVPNINNDFIQVAETTFSVGNLLFGGSLITGLILSIWAFILKIIPVA